MNLSFVTFSIAGAMSETTSDAVPGTVKAGSIDESSHRGVSALSAGQSSGHDPQFTSRVSIKRVVEVIQGFTEYKQWLVEDIGFGGVLKLPMIQKVSLKFSAWTMSKVDVVRQAICIRDDKVLKFWAEDFHKMSASHVATAMSRAEMPVSHRSP
jgi:hypothetical protein